jgi:hypothetical protein
MYSFRDNMGWPWANSPRHLGSHPASLYCTCAVRHNSITAAAEGFYDAPQKPKALNTNYDCSSAVIFIVQSPVLPPTCFWARKRVNLPESRVPRSTNRSDYRSTAGILINKQQMIQYLDNIAAALLPGAMACMKHTRSAAAAAAAAAAVMLLVNH